MTSDVTGELSHGGFDSTVALDATPVRPALAQSINPPCAGTREIMLLRVFWTTQSPKAHGAGVAHSAKSNQNFWKQQVRAVQGEMTISSTHTHN